MQQEAPDIALPRTVGIVRIHPVDPPIICLAPGKIGDSILGLCQVTLERTTGAIVDMGRVFAAIAAAIVERPTAAGAVIIDIADEEMMAIRLGRCA